MEINKDKVLVVRTCRNDMTAYHGFEWPDSGHVAAPDWKPTNECGRGLHGWLWGQGELGLRASGPDINWLVLEVDPNDIVVLDEKVKFPSCNVIYCGDMITAYEIIFDEYFSREDKLLDVTGCYIYAMKDELTAWQSVLECSYAFGHYITTREDFIKLEFKADGIGRKWHENGQLCSESTYKYEKKQGLYREWFYDGTLHIETTYKNGELDGVYNQFYDDGCKFINCEYKDGKLEGPYHMWRNRGDGGLKIIEYSYKNGLRHGKYLRWHTNGKIGAEYTYMNGNKHGECRTWGSNGEIVSDEYYVDGIRRN